MIGLLALLAALQAAAADPPASYPFAVGERFEYAAKYGVLSVGSASIQVASMDTVRGQPAFVFRYTLNASVPGGLFKINSVLESWTSVRTFRSLRFRQDSKENSKEYLRDYEIFADSGYYRQRGAAATTPTPAEPLDDASILYYVRFAPLAIGKTVKLSRYFKPELNPVVINVLKRETVELPDGTKAPCLVLNPVVGDRGLFGNRTDARLWITDDPRRIPVQIRSRQPYGWVTLKLAKMTSAAPARGGAP
jgi:hypothetical protein